MGPNISLCVRGALTCDVYYVIHSQGPMMSHNKLEPMLRKSDVLSLGLLRKCGCLCRPVAYPRTKDHTICTSRKETSNPALYKLASPNVKHTWLHLKTDDSRISCPNEHVQYAGFQRHLSKPHAPLPDAELASVLLKRPAYGSISSCWSNFCLP